MLSLYENALLTWRFSEHICEELDNEEWSKLYSDVDELFTDLGLCD